MRAFRNPLNDLFELRPADERDMMSDVRATLTYGARRFGLILLAVVGVLLTVLIAWAGTAEIAEITRGQGQVVPSGQNKVVQHLEGGVIREILVQEGDTVEAGQVLLRIDSTPSLSLHQEKLSGYYANLARAARLRAEAEGKDKVEFPKEVLEKAANEAAQERSLFRSRRDRHESEVEVLRSQIRQTQQELREIESSVDRLEDRLKSEQKELEETRSDFQVGAVARFDLIRIERQVNDTAGELRTEKLKIPRTRSALKEAESKLAEATSGYLAEVRRDLADVSSKIAAVRPLIEAGQAKVERADIRAPVKGIVKQVGVTTIGGVIKPGEALVEIVPLEGQLIVEARIQPQDRAFLHPGQPATVKVSAYDYSIYGGLEGKVIDISADAIEPEENKAEETYYRVRIRTDSNYLERAGDRLPIIAGMTATVDIRTGRKTILDAVLAPVYRVTSESLQER